MSDTLNTNEPNELSSTPSSETVIHPTSMENPAQTPARWKSAVKAASWIFLGLFCLAIFTLMKLPEERIRNYVQGTLSAQLSSQGITLSAAQSSLSIGFGISYTMKDVTLSFLPPQEPIKIEQISISPSLFSALTGKMGASVRLDNKGGTLKGFFSQPMNGSGTLSFSYDASNLDLGSIGALPLLTSLKGSAIANGTGEISGETNLPSSFQGNANLNLSKIVIDQQSVMGFSIPRLTIAEAKANVQVNGGKAVIKTFQIGKPGSTTDDLHGTMTGDITLGRNWQYSTLNLKTNFGLSQTVLKSFVLLDAILGAGKQPDGSYTFNIQGSISAPNPMPVSGALAPLPTPATPPHGGR